MPTATRPSCACRRPCRRDTHNYRWQATCGRVACLRALQRANATMPDDAVTWTAVHRRLRVQRGRASTHTCVDCGAPAKHWSLSWRRVDPSTLRFGAHPFSCDLTAYDPRCVSHARRYDHITVAEFVGAA